MDEPFGFDDVRELALPISTMTPANAGSTRAQLRRDSAQTAKLYLDALTRFDSIYRDGVGPAKRKPDYMNCKANFHAVATRIGALSDPVSEAQIDRIWVALKTCRSAGERWAGLPEMATFGTDLKAMADGAMLVLSYVATATGLSRGQVYYWELATPLRADEGRSADA